MEFAGKLYGGASLLEIPQWQNFERTKSSPVFTEKCCWPVYKYLGSIYRRINDDGSFGKLFSVKPQDIPTKTLYPVYSVADVAPEFKKPVKNYSLDDALVQNSDNRRFCEPVVWQKRDGKFVVLFRDDSRSFRKWIAFSDDGRKWTKPRPADMLDAPSLTCRLSLPNGEILPIGNHNGSGYNDKKTRRWIDRNPLMVSISDDGVQFGHTRSIRKGNYDYVVPYKIKIAGGARSIPMRFLKTEPFT